MAKTLQQIIKGSQFSQAEVARRIPMAPAGLSRWCTHQREIPDDKAIKIAEILRVTPFDVNPDFAMGVLIGIPEGDARDEARLAIKRGYKEKLLGPGGAASELIPSPSPVAPPSKDGRSGKSRTK